MSEMPLVPPETMAETDDDLLTLVQRRSFSYFWDRAHQPTGMAYDRISADHKDQEAPLATGGSGMGVMAVIVAADRGWISRRDAVARIVTILGFLETAECSRGMFPHYFQADTGREFSFWEGNAGGDVLETALMVVGLLCARQYFDAPDVAAEADLRGRIDALWRRIEWDWYTGGENVLIWHWCEKYGWGTRHRIRGWDECLIAYVLAASSPTHPTGPEPYHEGWASGVTFRNGKDFYGHRLPLGPDYGGPLFFAHFPFLGLDPRGLKDRYADYWEQVVAHALINFEHCVRNPNGYRGYGPTCWGITASEGNGGYAPHDPALDHGVIAPTAALSSFPYVPDLAMGALKHFYHDLGDQLWRECGFVDAFNPTVNWYSDQHLAIDQGPIVIMIENYRTGLLWRLFMSCPEVRHGLGVLGFETPAIS